MNNTPNSILPEVQQLINRGALFVVNHSAGKDSQAMTIFLKAVVPSEQLLVIHADLGEVEWPGNVDHIKSTIGNLPFEICKNENRTFLEMVRQRGMWPSPSQRQCTSDLKRGPIERTIRRHLAANPQFGGLVVNCMGIRAQESPARKKQIPFRLNSRNSLAERKLKNGKTVPAREWFDWLPIFELSEKEVFSMIEDAKQKPHWAYGAGMSRLSCCFCIMANRSDLKTAAKLRPALYKEYVDLEKEIKHTFSMSQNTLPGNYWNSSWR